MTPSREHLRAHVALLDLLLASPGLSDDLERRARWLRMGLIEVLDGPQWVFDLVELRIAQLLPKEGARGAQQRHERESSVAA